MSDNEINKSLWYLVRKDRLSKPWNYFIILLTFKTATQADIWADLYGYKNFFPMKGKDILEKKKDESAGLAKLIYVSANEKIKTGE